VRNVKNPATKCNAKRMLSAGTRKPIVARTVPEIAYVNGEFVPLERAVVHVEDRGFQFGDAVYEVIRTYSGKLFSVEEHVGRLFRSLGAIDLRHSFTKEQLASLAGEGVRRSEFAEAVVYLQVTRGRAPRNRAIPGAYEPTLVMTVRELQPLPAEVLENGVKVITLPDNRWARCDIKSVTLLANVLAYHEARQAGAHDAILIEPEGTVAEGTAGNVFVFAGGRLRTPPKGPRILSGVTREKVLAAAAAAGIPTGEGTITKQELLGADEVFLTSTTAEVLPVTSIDGRNVGAGKPGSMARRVYEQFLRMYAGR